MKQQIGVKALIVQNGHILLMKRSKKYEHIEDFWDIPGGRTEFGEEPRDGLKREIIEETGLTLKNIHKILDASTIFKNEQRHIVRITYLCSVRETAEETKISDEHTGFEWVPIKDIINIQFKDELLKKVVEKEKRTIQQFALLTALTHTDQ